MKNSQARTGHQRGMGGRWTDDDDTHERHTDTNKLTRHTASWLPHTLSWRTHNSRPHPPCRPPQHPTVPRVQTRAQRHNRRQEVTCEARAGLLYLQQSHRPARHGRDRMWGLVRCLRTPSSRASCLRLALYLALTGNDNPMYECMQAEARVLILDRTPWHMTWEACDRSAPVVRSAGERVSERVAGGAIPDF